MEKFRNIGQFFLISNKIGNEFTYNFNNDYLIQESVFISIKIPK